AIPKGDPAFLVGIQATAENRHQTQRNFYPEWAIGPVQYFGSYRTESGGTKPYHFTTIERWWFDLRPGAARHLLVDGIETQPAQRQHHARQRFRRVTQGQHALQQIELQPGNAGKAIERAANHCLF